MTKKSLAERKKSVYVLNYGCSANRAIAEALMGTLDRHGYVLTNSTEEAEVVIINTCVVKQNTEHRVKNQLLSLSNTKDIVITGCLPVVMRDWISQEIPQAKVLFPDLANQIIDLLDNRTVQEIKIRPPHAWSQLYSEDRCRFNPLITTVEISRGCLGACTFCIVKNIKGKIRSRSPDSILNEIKTALEKGSKEIWLTSQDTGAYGWDFSPKLYLPSLVDSITRLEGNFFVRLGMMTPSTIKKFFSPLVQQLQKSKVFSFLHLPIQSGSDSILHLMRRTETRGYFIDLLDRLHQKVNELVVATDIMVGFPGESQKDYNQTKKLLQEVKPTIVNLSKYTDRQGTLASQMTEKIPTKIKASRSRELTQLIRGISQGELKQWIGWEGIVLIDEFGKHTNQFVGRNTSYLPVVIEDEQLKLGQFITVHITDTGPTYLFGEIKRK